MGRKAHSIATFLVIASILAPFGNAAARALAHMPAVTLSPIIYNPVVDNIDSVLKCPDKNKSVCGSGCCHKGTSCVEGKGCCAYGAECVVPPGTDVCKDFEFAADNVFIQFQTHCPASAPICTSKEKYGTGCFPVPTLHHVTLLARDTITAPPAQTTAQFEKVKVQNSVTTFDVTFVEGSERPLSSGAQTESLCTGLASNAQTTFPFSYVCGETASTSTPSFGDWSSNTLTAFSGTSTTTTPPATTTTSSVIDSMSTSIVKVVSVLIGGSLGASNDVTTTITATSTLTWTSTITETDTAMGTRIHEDSVTTVTIWVPPNPSGAGPVSSSLSSSSVVGSAQSIPTAPNATKSSIATSMPGTASDLAGVVGGCTSATMKSMSLSDSFHLSSAGPTATTSSISLDGTVVASTASESSSALAGSTSAVASSTSSSESWADSTGSKSSAGLAGSITTCGTAGTISSSASAAASSTDDGYAAGMSSVFMGAGHAAEVQALATAALMTVLLLVLSLL